MWKNLFSAHVLFTDKLKMWMVCASRFPDVSLTARYCMYVYVLKDLMYLCSSMCTYIDVGRMGWDTA